MFNAARVPLSRFREHEPCENFPAHLLGRRTKFWPGTSMLEVFSCLRSVGRRCYDGVTSWRERIHFRRAFFMVSVVLAALGQQHNTFATSWVQFEMAPLVARLLHFMSRDKELRQLTTLVSSADHASSDGNSCRTRRQIGSGRPSKLLIGVSPNWSTSWSSPVC